MGWQGTVRGGDGGTVRSRSVQESERTGVRAYRGRSVQEPERAAVGGCAAGVRYGGACGAAEGAVQQRVRYSRTRTQCEGAQSRDTPQEA